MNIDDRLEKLAQRHEALAQSVELLTRGLAEMRGYVKDIADGTARLLHVAEIHERRISRLEGQND